MLNEPQPIETPINNCEDQLIQYAHVIDSLKRDNATKTRVILFLNDELIRFAETQEGYNSKFK